MVVLIVESVPVGLRGQLSKWMLEPKAGVFVGTLSAAVRDLLWEKACDEVGAGGATMIYRTDNEQGFAIRSFGETTRQIEEWEGLFLVRRLNPPPPEAAAESAPPPERDWDAMLYPSIWAKTDRGVALNSAEPPWHPLIAHMIDVAWVARRLWQYLLPGAVKEQVRAALGLPSVDEAGQWIAFFAGLHDLGKASPGFALRPSPTLERLRAEGFRAIDLKGTLPHGFISTYLLGRILTQLGLHEDAAHAIGFAVGGHHGTFPRMEAFRELRRQAGAGKWEEAVPNLALTLAHALGLDRLSPPTTDLSKASATLVILAGLTSVADWIGSNHDYFPFVGDQIQLPSYARLAKRRALKALVKLGWFHRPERVEALPFEELFHLVPNELQSAMVRLGEQLAEPSLVLVEYPMGGGKTEGALYLANCLHAQSGQQGFYLALPTMATSNQMFERAGRYLRRRFPRQVLNLQLMHGHADLHPAFAAMKDGEALPEPLVIQLPAGEEQKRDEAKLTAAEWFTNRKRGLLAPYGIGTIDQALMGALQTRHYFVRLFGLAGKVVILDEVHAYDTYMQKLLATLLSWLGAMGSSVILLSATLPASTREQLLQAYGEGRGLTGATPTREAVPYPRLTVANGEGIEALPLAAPADRTLALRYVKPGEAWLAELLARLAPGGSAAVLCNTVGRAQAVYEALTHIAVDCELLLFHARFPFDDRQRLEERVLHLFGKGKLDRPTRAICVATQVIEQSLDLDFDLMVTELAPVDLLLQRSGRVWRHERPERPPHFSGPELWVIKPSFNDEGVPDLPPAGKAVYDPHILLRTWLTIQDLDQVTIPGQMEPLLENVYKSEQPPEELSPALATYWRKTADLLAYGEQKSTREAKIRIIPSVSALFTDQVSDLLEEEDEGVHAAQRALTRLGGISVEVVCLFERDGHYWTDAVGGDLVQMERKPNRSQVRALLGRSLRFGFSPKLVKLLLATEVPDIWEAPAHLRRHRLLLFGPDGECRMDGLPLRLDPWLGLLDLSAKKEVSS